MVQERLNSRPKIRLYVPGTYTKGEVLELAQPQAHYAVNVMRADVGDVVLLFNGTDGEWRAQVETVGKKRASVRLIGRLREHRIAPDIWLVFAPIKNKTDIVVEKATELGAAKICPVLTRHSVVNSVNMEKLVAHAVEAAEQCERLDVPAIEKLQELPTLLAGWPKERLLLFADEGGGGIPMKELLSSLPAAPYALLVGPEGGFSSEERTLLSRQPFVRAFSMGSRILRSDTAVVATLACLMAWHGDWDDKPSFEGLE
jgi:16S rRNA (uracil1498-N3)-methyltransferase